MLKSEKPDFVVINGDLITGESALIIIFIVSLPILLRLPHHYSHPHLALSTSTDTHEHNATSYLSLLLAPLIKANIPFATTFGNHDNQAPISHRDQIEYIQKIAPLAYTMKCAGRCGGKGGEANYYVPVWECGRGKRSTSFLPCLGEMSGVIILISMPHKITRRP